MKITYYCNKNVQNIFIKELLYFKNDTIRKIQIFEIYRSVC